MVVRYFLFCYPTGASVLLCLDCDCDGDGDGEQVSQMAERRVDVGNMEGRMDGWKVRMDSRMVARWQGGKPYSIVHLSPKLYGAYTP